MTISPPRTIVLGLRSKCRGLWEICRTAALGGSHAAEGVGATFSYKSDGSQPIEKTRYLAYPRLTKFQNREFCRSLRIPAAN